LQREAADETKLNLDQVAAFAISGGKVVLFL
jgi:hypothetical protein